MKKILVISLTFLSLASYAETFFYPTLKGLSVRHTEENVQALCQIEGFAYAEASDYAYARPYEAMIDSVNANGSPYETTCIIKSENCDVISILSCI